ncbi:MAG: FAD:protein FMN transferase [Ruminiclostridium sp.]|nr:FAD:protein FMN transferase [Ruminiclostridium sp.]
MKRLLYLVIFLLLFIVNACTIKNFEPVVRSNFLLNTIVEITLFEDEKNSEIMLSDMFNEIQIYENKYSRYVLGSDIAKINESPGVPVSVSKDTIDMIEKSIYFSEISNGLFDISIGALVDLWNINSDNPRVPQQNEIYAAMQNVDYKDIILDKENSTVTLSKNGVLLDTGALAKGYITDKLVMYLKEKKVDSAILNLGGNLYLYGSKKDGSAWNIGIRNPFGYQGDYIGTVSVKNLSVVTSGIYERYFEEDGIRYHHILNPMTGYPENNNLASVSIITESSTMADGLSTTTFLLGLKEGMALVESLEGVEAIMVTRDKKIYLSSGIKNGEMRFKLTNEDYTLVK